MNSFCILHGVFLNECRGYDYEIIGKDTGFIVGACGKAIYACSPKADNYIIKRITLEG